MKKINVSVSVPQLCFTTATRISCLRNLTQQLKSTNHCVISIVQLLFRRTLVGTHLRRHCFVANPLLDTF